MRRQGPANVLASALSAFGQRAEYDEPSTPFILAADFAACACQSSSSANWADCPGVQPSLRTTSAQGRKLFARSAEPDQPVPVLLQRLFRFIPGGRHHRSRAVLSPIPDSLRRRPNKIGVAEADHRRSAWGRSSPLATILGNANVVDDVIDDLVHGRCSFELIQVTSHREIDRQREQQRARNDAVAAADHTGFHAGHRGTVMDVLRSSSRACSRVAGRSVA